MPPKSIRWTLDPHTAAKHRVLRGYLDGWLPILGQKRERLLVVDGFAGPGRYTGGEPGSPLVMLDAYLGHSARERFTAHVSFLFIEQDEDRCAALREEIDRYDIPPTASVRVHCGRFDEAMGSVIDGIGAAHRLVPTFAFIDPFGYADSVGALDVAGRILAFPRCEILLFVPLSFIARFIGKPSHEMLFTELFGGSGWKKARGMAPRAAVEAALHDELQARLLRECKYVRSIALETSRRNTNRLYFGSQHSLGIEQMKQAMWRLDPVAGEAYRDVTLPGQEVLFTPSPDYPALEQALRERFGLGTFTIEQAESFTTTETAFLARSHLKNKTLAPALKAKRLEVVSRSGSRGFPKGTVLRFVN